MEAKWRWVLICAIAPVSWGATYFVTRHFLPDGAPLWSAALRALPAGVILLAVARRLPSGSWWWRSLVLGLLNFGAFFVLVYLAAQLLPTSVAASVMALAPVALSMLAIPLLRQRSTAYMLIGAVLGVVGVGLLVGLGASRIDPLGVAISLMALLLSSLGAILATKWRDDLPLVATTSWQLVAGGLMLLVAAIVVEGAPPAMTSTNVLAYGAISLVATAIAFLCWFAGLRHLPAGTVGIIGLLNPVTGVLLGVLLAAESLASSQWWGLALVAAALVLGRSRHRAISVTGARTELRSGSRMDHVPRAPRG
ncbi:MAG: EamA family transporter [Actinobacteria bacterium]|nr:EamA family transporter [Actinomycetota bacterium]